MSDRVRITNKKNGHTEVISAAEAKRLQDGIHSDLFMYEPIKEPEEVTNFAKRAYDPLSNDGTE
jgi:hypothetical protein